MSKIVDPRGQVALITGAAGGIGRQLARSFARDGYVLILSSRDIARLQAVADDVRSEFGVSVTTASGDLSTPEGVQQLIADVDQLGLEIDVLVNNAGYGLVGLLTESDPQAQHSMLHVNVNALTQLITHYWSGILQRKRGGLLNVASAAAFQPCPFMAVYAAAKAYTLFLSEALWEEARGTGVHVTCLCPGPTESGFHTRSGTNKSKVGKASMQSAQEVAEAAYTAFKGNRRVIVPGSGNRIKAIMGSLMPNDLILPSVRKVFTDPQTTA